MSDRHTERTRRQKRKRPRRQKKLCSWFVCRRNCETKVGACEQGEVRKCVQISRSTQHVASASRIGADRRQCHQHSCLVCRDLFRPVVHVQRHMKPRSRSHSRFQSAGETVNWKHETRTRPSSTRLDLLTWTLQRVSKLRPLNSLGYATVCHARC